VQATLPDYPIDDFRIVDIQHRRYFRSTDVGMVGDERAQFVQRYAALLRIWEALKRER
jgi:hypothetical protein